MSIKEWIHKLVHGTGGLQDDRVVKHLFYTDEAVIDHTLRALANRGSEGSGDVLRQILAKRQQDAARFKLPSDWDEENPLAFDQGHRVTLTEIEWARDGILYLMGGGVHPDGEMALACLTALWRERAELQGELQKHKQAPRWFSVDEALPVWEHVGYLIRCSRQVWAWDGTQVIEADLRQGLKGEAPGWRRAGTPDAVNVTHWMSLPEPPQVLEAVQR